MIAPIPPTTAAAPLLFLALQKIARTPTPRLYVGYHIAPRYCHPCPETIGNHCALTTHRTSDRSLRPLGQALLLDRYLAGGIVNDNLPLSIVGGLDTRPLSNLILDAAYNAAQNAAGLNINTWA